MEQADFVEGFLMTHSSGEGRACGSMWVAGKPYNSACEACAPDVDLRCPLKKELACRDRRLSPQAFRILASVCPEMGSQISKLVK